MKRKPSHSQLALPEASPVSSIYCVLEVISTHAGMCERKSATYSGTLLSLQ